MVGSRSRVFSFVKSFGGEDKTRSGNNSPQSSPKQPNFTTNSALVTSPVSEEPPSRNVGRPRADSRPLSIIPGYTGPHMDTNDAVPELLPIFNLLNSHQNKLYQEGYFLKLNDLDSQGRPYNDRSWTECFAQLVGTVLSLWDAAALDNAQTDGEVPATFINLGDASIRMIETLETRSKDAQPLQNVLSVSTAGKNRYLLHFSTVNALTQWTAGIRLAMFEHSSLQETYTGALIAGKARTLNSINQIMVPSKFPTSDWVRVRFGAGTPWRRCWCIITPPDEKEVSKAQKAMKKRGAYDRTQIVLKGDVKFYESKKINKKTMPIATITNAYAAYAIYPQSKALIEQSTLIKIEGNVTIHTNPETKLESFIFVMPETHQMVSGFEMLLRFLFPIWDVFALYGRPQRLLSDPQNVKSLMFAMPKHDRWGYLDILDISTLVTRPGSSSWAEVEWKKELKKLTFERIEKLARDPSRSSRPASQYGRAHRNSLPSRTAALRFTDDSSPDNSQTSLDNIKHRTRAETASPGGPSSSPSRGHGRSTSESLPSSPQRRPQDGYQPSRLSREAARPGFEDDVPPPPPAHALPSALVHGNHFQEIPEEDTSQSQAQSVASTLPANRDVVAEKKAKPVQAPPAFSHAPGAKPQTRPSVPAELRRANSRMSSATLSQLAAASGAPALVGSVAATEGRRRENSVDDIPNVAYNRSYPSADNLSNLSGHLANSSISSGYASDTSSLEQSRLRAPGQAVRSVSPLHQVQAMTPTERAKDSESYFTNNPYGAQNQGRRYSRSQPALALVQDRTINHRSSHSPSRPGKQLAPVLGSPLPPSPSKIGRKPVPASPSRAPDAFLSPVETSPTDAIRTKDVNDALMNRMDTVASKTSTISRQYSVDESRYDDDGQESIHHLPPIPRETDKPRPGVLKVVGDPAIEQDESWKLPHTPNAAPSIPTVDFGPTTLFKPSLPEKRKSLSPTRSAFIASRAAAFEQSPNQSSSPVSSSYTKSPSKDAQRIMPWQPGTSTQPETGTAVTPEKLVQLRAESGRLPYSQTAQNSSPRSHSRQASHTPPAVSRHSSADWSGSRSVSRNSMTPPPDYNRLLSAREQENVARATGAPLLNIEKKSSLADINPGGLVSAIAAREEEKKAAKAGYMSSVLVQQAVQQRQQEQQQRQAEQQRQIQRQQMHSQQGSYSGMPGGFPITPQFHPETTQQYPGFGGPAYGRQAPQDYRQPAPNAYQQGQTYPQYQYQQGQYASYHNQQYSQNSGYGPSQQQQNQYQPAQGYEPSQQNQYENQNQVPGQSQQPGPSGQTRNLYRG